MLSDAIEMSHLRRLNWAGFVWFYRDVAPTALGLDFVLCYRDVAPMALAYEVMYWFFNFNSMEIRL